MSAEPDWTVPTLKAYFERIFEEKDKAINIALAAAKEAVLVAERNAEKWRDSANEWRDAMNDREKNFLPRAEFCAYKESTERALGIEKQRADLAQGAKTGLTQGWGILIGAVTIVSLFIGIFYALR